MSGTRRLHGLTLCDFLPNPWRELHLLKYLKVSRLSSSGRVFVMSCGVHSVVVCNQGRKYRLPVSKLLHRARRYACMPPGSTPQDTSALTPTSSNARSCRSGVPPAANAATAITSGMGALSAPASHGPGLGGAAPGRGPSGSQVNAQLGRLGEAPCAELQLHAGWACSAIACAAHSLEPASGLLMRKIVLALCAKIALHCLVRLGLLLTQGASLELRTVTGAPLLMRVAVRTVEVRGEVQHVIATSK